MVSSSKRQWPVMTKPSAWQNGQAIKSYRYWYPTPGSLGTYAGLERGYSTLTYEIERGLALDQVLAVHVPAIRECLKVTEHSLNKGKF